MATNVKVAVRCRPLSSKENAMGCKSKVVVDNTNGQISCLGSDDEDKGKFTFDFAYAPGSGQKEIYDDIGAPLVDNAIEGFNATIFAYGQTGSGKTFTMMGVPHDKELRGVIPRLTDHLFERVNDIVEKTGGSLGETAEAVALKDAAEGATGQIRFMITVSYLEIYNEELHDLLNPQATHPLKIREHPDMGIYVEHLCELTVTQPADIFRLLDQGNRVRRVASTQMNERSSRSHSVFSVKLAQKTVKMLENDVQRETALSSKLNLVDLAGSERAGKTGAEGSTLKEGAAINQSLMALGGVINALSGASAFVPYRNSKLTRLLQESLGGNAGTMMVANVSPADYNTDETVGTLRYASRAKKIQNTVTRNEDVHERVIRELQEEIERLRGELASGMRPGSANGGALSAEQEAAQEAALEDARAKEAELQSRVEAMELAKDTEWMERERLSAALESERKNNLNLHVTDIMSSVKSEKLRLLTAARTVQEKRAARLKEQVNLKDQYKRLKVQLEHAMSEYESTQADHDRQSKVEQASGVVAGEDETAATRPSSVTADALVVKLQTIESTRGSLLEVRSSVLSVKTAVHDLDQQLTAIRAELAAATSTIAENDRLRSAIQEEERAAFQSQRDEYLSEQLRIEKDKLQQQRVELSERSAELTDKALTVQQELAAVSARADLLQQEVDMVKSERDHLTQRCELLTSDLDHSGDEKSKLAEELKDAEMRLQTAEYDAEAERDKAEVTRDELKRATQSNEQQELELARLAGERAARGASESKHADEDSLEQRRLTAALQCAVDETLVCERQCEQLREELQRVRADQQRERHEAKESEFRVFKRVMDAAKSERDAANAERHALLAKTLELQKLLKHSVQDILCLQNANDQYRRELDMRRKFDDS